MRREPRFLLIVALFLMFSTGCAHVPPHEIQEPGASTRFLGIDRAEVKKTILKHTKEIKDCFFHQASKNPVADGKIVIQFEIGENGAVLNTQTLSTTFKTDEVEKCTVAHLKTWKFTAPLIGDTAIVSYPFIFRSEE